MGTFYTNVVLEINSSLNYLVHIVNFLSIEFHIFNFFLKLRLQLIFGSFSALEIGIFWQVFLDNKACH